jgi:CDP-diacylglycerol--glycerol-3-phosphate 3-phosphatidyltransferase
VTTGSPDAASASKFFTVSNLLSISRIFLAVSFVLVMLAQAPWSRAWGIVIICVAALTDNLDGRIARYLHQETEWGRILDPLADKLGIAAAGLVLLYLGLIPIWFVAVMLARDLMILCGGMYVKATLGAVLPSTTMGKWTVGVLCATLLLILCDSPALVVAAFIWGSTAMLMLSFALYVRRFIEAVSMKKE